MNTLKYLRDRQTEQLAALGDEEVDRRLAAVATRCGLGWLENDQRHPLQLLWSRRDALATNQLVILGNAVLSVAPNNERWVESQFKKIKSDDGGTRAGAMFELLALDMLKAHSVKPTPRGYPGYDVLLGFSDGASLLVSCKSHGKSIHERTFLEKCANIDNFFVRAATTLRVSGLVLRATASSYPTDIDWRDLACALHGILRKDDDGRGQTHNVGNIWNVLLDGPPVDVLPLSGRHLSYKILMTAPFHRNEATNLIYKLESAASNARRHSGAATAVAARAAFIRIPPTIGIGICSGWAQEYLDANPNGPLDRVLIYQPSIADSSDGNHVISHAFRDVRALSYARWVRPERDVRIECLVGMTSPGTIRQIESDGRTEALTSKYVYQHGEFYTAFRQNKPVTANFTLRRVTTDVLCHAVIELNDGSEAIVRGIFPPESTFSLFE